VFRLYGVFDVKVSSMALSKFDSVERLFPVGEDGGLLYTFANPYSYYILKDELLFPKFNKIFADGILLVSLHNLFFSRKINRISFDFTSLAGAVLNYCASMKYKVGIIGGTAEEAKKAADVFVKRFDVDMRFVSSGFTPWDEGLVTKLKSSEVEVLIVGMGTPMQEHFLLFAKDRVPSLKVGFTCGGFLSQTAIKAEYYNNIINRLHLRWLQRACLHAHVRKRLFRDYPLFVCRYLREQLRNVL